MAKHIAPCFIHICSRKARFFNYSKRAFFKTNHKTSYGKEGGVEMQNWDITTRGTAKSSKKSN